MADEDIGGIEVLQLARQEIVTLRKEVHHLRPLAEAYDTLKKAVDMIGNGGYSVPQGRDVVEIIDSKLKDIQKAMAQDRNSGQNQPPSSGP